MPAYAVAHMRRVTMGPAIVEYLERIDATLAPFGGHFTVHGGDFELLEGAWPGNLIVIEFPDREHARAWYNSDWRPDERCRGDRGRAGGTGRRPAARRGRA
jgi:uncharacterized protein (DUF1330 family)